MGGLYIGVDVGTASARAGVFDEAGRLVASARRPIALFREAGEVVEHASADIWAATTAAVREAAGPHAGEIAGLGFDATCSLVALDDDGGSLTVSPKARPERDTIVWMDHRAVKEAAEINAGGHDPLRFLGGAVSPEMQPPKLIWLARHIPETFARAQFFDLTDFLTWKASGSRARSTCTVVCKWLYQGAERRWPEPTYRAIGLGALLEDGARRIGAEIVAPGTPLGRGLTAEAAEAMGLKPGLPVAAGVIDAHAGALGTIGGALGAQAPDARRRLALILGTSSCCMALADEARFVPGVWGPLYDGLVPGQWLTEGGQSAFGAAIDRLLRMHPLGPGRSFEALERDILARCGSASQAARLARDLHVVPDFNGNRSPFADPRARGALLGLDLDEDEASLQALYVAGLCGLAQGLAQVVRALEAGGFAFDALVASGGAARGALVRQIVADVCGRRVVSAETQEPVLLGSAMLGAVAAGRYDLAGAMRAMSRLGHVVEPAGGEVAALHARKRMAFETLQRAERDIRAAAAADWPKLVIFDCDGVLVDSEPISMAVTRATMARHGLEVSEAEAQDMFLGVSAASARKAAEARLGAPLPADFESRLAREVVAEFEHALQGIPGVRAAVAALGAPVCVASSSAPERIQASLALVGYSDLFGPRVFSAQLVEHGKPAPDLLLHAAARLGVAPADCLVVEDSEAGVTAARRAGMTAFGFVGGSHHAGSRYGERLKAAGAALVFDDMGELPKLVARAATLRDTA
jgi:FGGY-family pentulose kinase/HAD superfamily hydrolase (TIGR01509 family)